jgi:hypothetical protein
MPIAQTAQWRVLATNLPLKPSGGNGRKVPGPAKDSCQMFDKFYPVISVGQFER